MTRKLLIPGQWYYIVLSDCCIQGSIIGQFIGYLNEYETLVEDGFEYEYLISTKPEVEYWEAIFNFGVLGPYWGEWHATPIHRSVK